MECTTCKRELKSSYNYCPFCGEKLEKVEVLAIEDNDGDYYPDGFDPKLYNL
jgi:predicted amidophosphoribosyltransferase